ncbi:uncharacterized protein LOC144716035 [Wolffia australiana]
MEEIPPFSNGSTAPPEPQAFATPPPKRQRRPSVRLGEIGGQQSSTASHDQSPRRSKLQWRATPRTRPLTNLVAEDFGSDSAPEIRVSGMETELRDCGREEEDGGVKGWLNGLGLGRYAPVFDIHEVDEEVLPLLTLEDLKDMGINAVGSRRKLFCAIQKLGESSS